jgi:hypothetical protein
MPKLESLVASNAPIRSAKVAKAAIWDAVFAAMNPSPIFVAVAEFAQTRVEDHQRRAATRKIEQTRRFPWSGGEACALVVKLGHQPS